MKARPVTLLLGILFLIFGWVAPAAMAKNSGYCLECHSQNCVTHWWDDPEFGRDYYGECLDCGGVDCAWEGSSVWDDFVRTGVVA